MWKNSIGQSKPYIGQQYNNVDEKVLPSPFVFCFMWVTKAFSHLTVILFVELFYFEKILCSLYGAGLAFEYYGC
jgi:hypothetical protein